MKRITVLLADDHLLFAECVQRFLQKECDIAGIVRDGRAMIHLAHRYRPDIILADISMPLLNGIEATRVIRKELPSTRILLLTMHDDVALAEEGFAAGANGFINKTTAAEELLNAIRTVARGETYLTPSLAAALVSVLTTVGPQSASDARTLTTRQRQIVQLLAEGKTMKEAAAILNISTRTAECHKYEIMRKLAVKTKADLIRYAVRVKLV